jgi:RNA polymerase sigma-70 factor (ECF subfamily)
MATVAEADLITRAGKGDLAAFNALVEHYQSAVYSLCLRMLGSQQPAEDAAQEAFLAAYRHLERFRGGVFRPWLFRIAANACYDELRRRRARPAASLDAPHEGERPHDVPGREASPEERAEGAELRQAIEAALARLPFEQRLVIVLCDVQGLDYAEIAQATGASLGTVKSRISRGRLAMRALLQEHAELLPSRFRPTNEAP